MFLYKILLVLDFEKKNRISHFAIRIRIFAFSHFAIRTKMRKCDSAKMRKCDAFASHSHRDFAEPSHSHRIRIRFLRSRRIRIAFAFEDECEFTSLPARINSSHLVIGKIVKLIYSECVASRVSK